MWRRSADRSRPFRPGDAAALCALVRDAWRIEGPRHTFHAGDVEWRLRPQPGRDPKTEIRLWFDARDRLAGFAWREPPEWGDLQYRPGVARGPLETQMLEWLEAETRAAGSESLTVGGFADDAVRCSLLEARGYLRCDTSLRHMRTALGAAPPPAPVPPGYAVHSAAGADVSAQARASARAFDHALRPASTYWAVRQGPGYRNELDVVVTAPAGELASYCRGWLDACNRVGLLEPVGTDPDHRRRGLARAAVTTVLRRMRALGAESAVVYPMSDNPAAFALYEACGFRVFADDYDWKKRLA